MSMSCSALLCPPQPHQWPCLKQCNLNELFLYYHLVVVDVRIYYVRKLSDPIHISSKYYPNMNHAWLNPMIQLSIINHSITYKILHKIMAINYCPFTCCKIKELHYFNYLNRVLTTYLQQLPLNLEKHRHILSENSFKMKMVSIGIIGPQKMEKIVLGERLLCLLWTICQLW